MGIAGWLILIVVCVLLYIRYGVARSPRGAQGPAVLSGGESSGLKYGGRSLLTPLPKGFQIYADGDRPAGMQHYKSNAAAFVQSRDQRVELEPDPANPHDKNAIKVIGVCADGVFHIGYLPADLAAQLSRAGLVSDVRGRLDRVYQGTDGYLEIKYQVIGPRAQMAKFRAAE